MKQWVKKACDQYKLNQYKESASLPVNSEEELGKRLKDFPKSAQPTITKQVNDDENYRSINSMKLLTDLQKPID